MPFEVATPSELSGLAAERVERSPSSSQARFALPAIVLGASGGYYLGSLLGLQLRLLPATTSVLWPPNSILTAILILTPVRRWPVVLLSALPVHVLLQLQTGWPLSLILTLFLTNCLEAALAASGLRLLSDAPARLDTLRRLVAFLLAVVIVAPVIATFADAAAVAWLRGEPYWLVWQTRLFSAVLAELTIVPAIVGVVRGVLQWRSRPLISHPIEAALLGLGLCGIGALDYSGSLNRIPALQALSSQTPLAVQLPFLLWAAVRFGPTGVGLTLLATSVLGTWTLVHGAGPYATLAPATTVTAFTLSLIVVGVTLLSLATLVEERRQTQHALAVRLRFEGLLSRLSAALVQLPGERMNEAIETWLGRIGGMLGVEGLTLFTTPDVGSELTPAYSWVAPRSAADVETIAQHHRRWALRSQRAAAPSVADTGDRGLVDELLAAQSGGPMGGGAVLLVGERQLLGVLAFGPMSGDPWPADVVVNIELVAEVLASAFRRKRSENALRESELTKSAILQSLTSGVAVVDRTGRLLQMNERWIQFRGVCAWMDVATGGDLLDSCRAAAAHGETVAAEVALGIAAVLSGARERFDLESRTEIRTGAACWTLSAVKLHRLEEGAVLTCTDVTELRRAEMEAQRSRQELAHVSRVTTVGELTASLAHQLNQPLTAIMTNAQAAQRILDAQPPDLAEVRAILRDIVNDDRRASDVILRLRDLLRKGELEMTRVNFTAAIREVVELMASEAVIRDIAVWLQLGLDPVYVCGDRVQLQQVVLNLLYNAMEAVLDRPEGSRTVTISCQANGPVVLVRVLDSGPGLKSGTEELVFEAFYTTKNRGMGMGLSIARSILEAHGGSIRAINDLERGAIFEVTLPLDPGRPALRRA